MPSTVIHLVPLHDRRRQLGAILLLAILAIAGCDAVLTTAPLPPVREDGILGEWKDLGTPGSPPKPIPC